MRSYWRKSAWRCHHFLFSAGRRLQSHPWPQRRPPAPSATQSQVHSISVISVLEGKLLCSVIMDEVQTNHDPSSNQGNGCLFFASLGFIIGGQSGGDAVGRGVRKSSSIFFVFKECWKLRQFLLFASKIDGQKTLIFFHGVLKHKHPWTKRHRPNLQCVLWCCRLHRPAFPAVTVL